MQRILGFALFFLACGGGESHPDAAPDAGPGEHWDLVFDRLADGALTCGFATGSHLFLTGGKDLGMGGGTILHYDGSAWTRMPNPAPALLWWVFGFGPSDVWAVGQNAAILHWDGSAWTAMPAPSSVAGASLAGVWGAAPNEVWAVGAAASAPPAPVILRWDGTQWMVANPGTSDRGGLFKVWGADRTHVWAVGMGGLLLAYDGAQWTQPPRVSASQLVTVHGRSATDVWAVGGMGNGSAFRFDGQSWQPLDGTGAFPPLLGVFADPGGPVIVVGQQGFLATWSRARWHLVDPPPTLDCLHNVTAYAGGYVAMGGNLLSPGVGLHGVLLRSGSPLSSHLP
ncbi:MAG TPA: hypothetical protein VKN99_25480 [Polyangia bacterium]|nr:hypothetical protein [Polyangia bacterium]